MRRQREVIIACSASALKRNKSTLLALWVESHLFLHRTHDDRKPNVDGSPLPISLFEQGVHEAHLIFTQLVL